MITRANSIAVIVLPALSVLLPTQAAHAADNSFIDCEGCPRMVVVPSGSFMMGGKPNPQLAFNPEPDETPRRQVTVRSFAIGKFEVTQDEWQALMGANPSDYVTGDGRLPVETVSWYDAQEFLRRLSAKSGRLYRLPTEAEWEYAARAGSDALFSFGDDPAELGRYAWFSGNSGGHINPVGTREANAFGLHDMHGNVWEWVEDCYRPSYLGAPTDGSAVTAVGRCPRNNRGGSWVNTALNLRSDHRHKMGGGSRGTFIGLRVARSLTPP